MLERFRARREPYQDIDIAVDPSLVAKHRSKQSQPIDPKQADLGLGNLEAANRLITTQRLKLHTMKLPESR